MRTGRIVVYSYVVDLDNEEMIERAKTCAYEDIMNAVKYNEVGNLLSVEEASGLDPSDIPEFLKDEGDYE
ncbi:MAG: hypothetical protein KAS36_12640 [Anaerolineales bacterium]|nr:hypothetical protein [Anaerolineales bacterium]